MRNQLIALSLTFSCAVFAQKTSGIRLDIIDKSVDPKQDFFQYSSGVWLKNNTIPETESAWGSFNEIEDRNQERLRSIVNEVSSDKGAAKGTDRQLVGTFPLRLFFQMYQSRLGLSKDALDSTNHGCSLEV